MPNDYTNLKKLMQGTENFPEVSDSRTSDRSPTPQYKKFLENTRESVMDDYTDEYQEQDDYKPDWDAAGSLYRAMNPGLDGPEADKKNWSEQSEFYKRLVDEGTVDRGPGLVDSIQDRWGETHAKFDEETGEPFENSRNNVVDRNAINKKILDSYVKDLYPSQAYNSTLPNTNTVDLLGQKLELPNEDVDWTDLVNTRNIAQELTGEDIEHIQYDPYLRGSGNLGTRNVKTGVIKIGDPRDVSTTSHEALHQKFPGGYSENIPDLQNADNLDQAVRDAQNAHIPYQTDAQKKYKKDVKKRYIGSEGESGFYYDRIRKILENK